MPVTAGIHHTLHTNGNADRPPLILIHGAGGNLFTWHPKLRRLGGETVYTLDLPGHGESPGRGRQSIREYADDVLRFMDAEKISNAILMGISMGSAIALTIALHHPQRITKLILIGAGGKMRVAQSILDGVTNPNTFEATVETINTNCFSEHAAPDLLRLSKEHMLAAASAVLHDDFSACNQFDLTHRLSEIRTPALILCGTEDKMMPPKFSQSLHAALPNSQLHIIENAGHMPQLEQPDIVITHIRAFLDETPPPPTG
jgi:pimeloyl-ACP methyl ester carboxylesterase